MSYDRAPLKPPVWTWEVPLYFFTGGAAGGAAVIAAVAHVSGVDPPLVVHARWIAAAGAAVSPLLLISDLGKPSRFLNMLRVFKLQSPMSVGAWTLVVFSSAVFTSVACDWWLGAERATALLGAAVMTGDIVAGLTGLVLATYTGVLIGATAIPAWSARVRVLPFLFGASALGAAVSLIELTGHRTVALNLAGIGAAAIETMTNLAVIRQRDTPAQPGLADASGRLLGSGGLLTGPLPLVLRIVAGHSTIGRIVTAALTVIGSLLTRFGWIALGRRSAADPRSL